MTEVQVQNGLPGGDSGLVHRAGVDLSSSDGVLKDRLVPLGPAGQVDDGQGSTGVARRDVYQVPIGLLPRAPPQVDTKDEHALSRRVTDLGKTCRAG